jgi:WD40 repeat protein
LIVHDLLLEKDKSKPRIIQRDSLLRTVAINSNASLIALGDDFGKIYIVHLSGKQTIVQTLHWHAHRVSALQFIPDTPYLLSAGEEAVIVQWHLETQNKSFISRLGTAITNIGLSLPSQTYYSVSMSDNSVKVIRFDNNKVKAHL